MGNNLQIASVVADCSQIPRLAQFERTLAVLHVQMETYEASITSFLVPSEGKPQLITYNDTGHLPAQMITGGVRGTRTQ